MVTNSAEYAKLLWKIQDQNPPTTALLLPSSEQMISVDLHTRSITAPEFLSVATDHRAETVYFVLDRFHDNVDLSTMNCVVEFVSADKNGRNQKSGLFAVPFTDKETLSREDRIIVPWLIEGLATAQAGIITYSLKFFQISPYNNSEFSYVLNTQPAKSKILEGNDFNETAFVKAVDEMMGSTLEELDKKGFISFSTMGNNIPQAYEQLIAKMNEISQDERWNIYWIDI